MFTSLSAVRLLLAKKRCILLSLYLSYSKKKNKKKHHALNVYIFPMVLEIIEMNTIFQGAVSRLEMSLQ